MNIANRLTILRIILTPFACACILYSERLGWAAWLAGGLIFAVAAITDALDGNIARSRGLVSDFGKLMDPVADKLLVSAVLISLVSVRVCSAWVPIVVLLREFIVTSMRMVAASKGKVLAANAWGKVKTATQMSAIGWTMFVSMLCAFGIEAINAARGALMLSAELLLWLSALATIISGSVLVYQNRELFSEK